jgi:hypothetical protein
MMHEPSHDPHPPTAHVAIALIVDDSSPCRTAFHIELYARLSTVIVSNLGTVGLLLAGCYDERDEDVLQASRCKVSTLSGVAFSQTEFGFNVQS